MGACCVDRCLDRSLEHRRTRPGPPDTPAERFKRPQVLHFGHLEVLPELESTPLFCSVTLQQPVLFAGPHCNMDHGGEKSGQELTFLRWRPTSARARRSQWARPPDPGGGGGTFREIKEAPPGVVVTVADLHPIAVHAREPRASTEESPRSKGPRGPQNPPPATDTCEAASCR